MKKAKISVLIPSYNHSPYIRECIESVLNQTFTDIEILIGDDCSTDNSREIIDSYTDPRIKKFFYSSNCGGSENLNRLIDMSSCEYIAILNSDDYWEPEKLEKQFKFLENNKQYAACFTWVQYIDKYGKKKYPDNNVFIQENKTQAEWLKYFLETGNCLCHPSILIRKKVYDEIGKYNRYCRQIPDFILWIKLIQKYPIYIMPELLVNFRWLGTAANTSGFSIANMNRTYHEYHMLAEEIFDNCPMELLHDAYNINITLCKKYDVIYCLEKNLIIFNSKVLGNIGKLVAYTNIGKLFENEKNCDLLKQELGFDINDYYKMGESLEFHEIKIDKITEKVPDAIAYSRGYKFLNKCYNSKLYKIRKKIRSK